MRCREQWYSAGAHEAVEPVLIAGRYGYMHWNYSTFMGGFRNGREAQMLCSRREVREVLIVLAGDGLN